MHGDGMKPAPLSDLPDAALWRHSLTVDVNEDETERYLDLAGYADGLLDADEAERIAEWLGRDPLAAADVTAARALAETAALDSIPGAIAQRACALVVEIPPDPASNVVAFRPRPHPRVALQGLARWGSMVAAAVVAGWLGLTLGIDTSRSLAPRGQVSDESLLHEMIDPSPGFLRDLTDGRQT